MSRLLSLGRIVAALVAIAALVGVVGWSTGLMGSSDSAAPPGGISPDCVAEPGAEMRDVDEEDSREFPWPHEPGQRVVVQFEIADLSPRYAGFVTEGARLWSQSPCVETVAVARCEDGANCATVREEPESPDGSTDGEASSTDRDGERVRSEITLYTDLLDDNTENGALATVVHEMGHVIGLQHRNDSDAMMNATTGPDTDPNPDEIDFYNLTVLYGSP